MNIVTCKERKNYNLTVGKKYMVIKENCTFFTIVNDIEKKQRYNKKYFKYDKPTTDTCCQPGDNEVATEVAESTGPIPATTGTFQTEGEETPRGRNQDIIDSMRMTNEFFIYTMDGANRRVPIRLSWSESDISCGIIQVTQLNEQANEFHNKFEGNVELKADLMAKAVELYATSENTGFNGSQIILSTNLDGMGARPDIMRNLDFIASVHSTSVNPNSGNTICVWIVNTNQEPHQEVLDERAELEEEVREEGLVGEVFV